MTKQIIENKSRKFFMLCLFCNFFFIVYDGSKVRGSFNKQGGFFSIKTYNSDRNLIFVYFFVFVLIHMDEISFAD